jgi:hypothetical protein
VSLVRAMDTRLAAPDGQLVRPAQYVDKWRLDRTGVRAVPNLAVKRALGFAP